MINSDFKNKKYDTNDAIRILNSKQAAFYWANGCEPVNIFISKDYTTNDPIIVYTFLRSETQKTGVYDTWCNRKTREA